MNCILAMCACQFFFSFWICCSTCPNKSKSTMPTEQIVAVGCATWEEKKLCSNKIGLISSFYFHNLTFGISYRNILTRKICTSEKVRQPYQVLYQRCNSCCAYQNIPFIFMIASSSGFIQQNSKPKAPNIFVPNSFTLQYEKMEITLFD